MKEHIMASHHVIVGTETHPVLVTRPAHEAFELLRLGFAVMPIAAGLDKFFNLLAQWEEYLSPPVLQSILGTISPSAFLRVVGFAEICIGILVAVRPRIGAYVVALWLICIVLNLLLLGQHYDILLRDLGLAAGALALGRLSEDEDPS